MIAYFRPIFFTFIFLALGIFVGKLYYYDSPIFFYVANGLFFAFFVLFLLSLFIKHKQFFIGIWKNKYKFLTIIVAFYLGFGLFVINYNTLNTDFVSNKNTEYYIAGYVDNNYTTDEDTIYFMINNVSVVADNEEYKPQDKFLIYVDVTEVESNNEIFNLQPNDLILFCGKIYNRNIFEEEYINTYAYKNGYQHVVYCDALDIAISKGEMGFMDSVRERIRTLLDSNMESDMAKLAYSVLTGDGAEVAPEIMEDFQRSGIAHIIAVSGLNIAFIALLLMFIFKPLKIKKKWQLIIIFAVLLLYCWLCNFVVSVMRATIMYMFLLLGNVFGKQNDSLSSVSLAGILLLLVQPLGVFDLSFQLSFSSVFAMILLMPLFQNLYRKVKHKAILDTISMSLACSIGTMPFLVNAFDQISVIGLVANVILVPFFGYVYMALFLVIILSLILPFMQYALWLIQWGLYVTCWGSALLSSVSFAVVSVPKFYTWNTTLYLSTMFVASYNCLLKRKIKLIVFIIMLIGIITGLVLSALL